MSVYDKNYEVDNQTGVNHEGPEANSPVRRLTARSITGDKIVSTDGEELGKIEDIMINLGSGQIEYIVMDTGSFLGIGGKLFAVPFGELTLDPGKEVFVMNRSKEYLKQAPGFDKNHWPDTNNHSYFESVNSYYDVTPLPTLPL